MQDAHTGSFTNPSNGSSTSGSSGGAPPPERHTRFNTISAQPTKLGAVVACFLRRAGRNGFARKDEAIAAMRTVDRDAYGDSAGQELFRFLEAYGALFQKSGRWWVDAVRFQEVIIACENKKPLPYDFVVGTVPGAACGCPQGAPGSGNVKPAAKGGTPPANGGEPKPQKAVIRRLAYMTYVEYHALEVIHAFMQDTVVGEFRSPTHMDDEAFRNSEFGKLFGWPRELFVAILDRFVAAGIIVVRSATGPDGTFDALVFQIPFAEIQVTQIIDRRPQAIPAIVMDLIVRTLDLEGLISFKDGLMTTVKKAMVDRLSRRGIGHGDKVVDVFANRLFHFNEAQPENGWGLVLPGVKGADAVICLPGFAPVQFVEDSTFMKSLPRGVTVSVPAQEVPTAATPKVRVMTLEDIQGLGDEALATHLADAEALLAALQAEKPRREAERALAARRAELQARLAAVRAEEAARAQAEEAARMEAERLAAEKVAAQREREALEAALAEL